MIENQYYPKGFINFKIAGRSSRFSFVENVNNYLIKARKALKEGKIEEADKLAWRACSLMHEDEMQGPGVSADKNAYNIFHKQLGNIQNAIIAARKANKESN